MSKYILDKEKYLGNHFIELADKRIDLPAPIRYIETFNEDSVPKIVILYSLNADRIGLEPKDNIHCYNKDGKCLWTLKDLIFEYNKTFSVEIRTNNYYHIIKKLDFNILYTIESECYYYINVPRRKIIYLEGHK